MNLSAFTLSAAAAVSPGVEPVTNQEIVGALNPQARVVALEEGGVPTAEPLVLDDGASQAQDPQKQEAPKQEAQPQGTPEAPKQEPQKQEAQKPAETQPAQAPEAKAAQEPAPQAPELSPDKKLDFAVAMHQLKAIDESIYKRILAGESIEQVLKDARIKLDSAFEKNELSLSSIERALRDPEALASVQKSARDRIDKKNDDGFDVRENAYQEKSLRNRFKKEDQAKVEILLDELREAMQIRKDEAGILHNKMEPSYLKNQTLRGALTVTPMSQVVAGLSLEAREDLTILRSPNNPNSALKPEEVRVLTDSEKAAIFEKARPVEGNDPRPALKEHRQQVMEKLSDAEKAQLLELEKRALEVARQEVVMGTRGIPSGIEYHVAVDRSNSARGQWQAIENYADSGIKMVYEGSIHLRDQAKGCLKPKDIASCISALEAMNRAQK